MELEAEPVEVEWVIRNLSTTPRNASRKNAAFEAGLALPRLLESQRKAKRVCPGSGTRADGFGLWRIIDSMLLSIAT